MEDRQRPDTWFKTSRSIIDHPIWNDCPPLWIRVWMALLALANYSPRKRRFGPNEIDLQPGQLICSVDWLRLKCNISVKITRAALNYLQRTSAVTIQTASHGTLITISNWERYQGRDWYEGQAIRQAEGQTKGKRRANEGQTKGNARRRIEGEEGEEPPLSDGNPPSDSTPLNLTSPDGNGPGKRKLRKPVKSETMGWPPWKLAAWQTIYSEDPKKYYAAGAIEIFNEAVETEAQASWLTAAHREQCAACPATKWPGLRSWLEGQTRAMRSGITVEQASNGMEAF